MTRILDFVREVEIEIPANGDRFGTFEGASEAGIALSPLGLVVSEHVDKIGFFEPGVEVRDKEILPDRIRFKLRMGNDGGEVRRGDRSGIQDRMLQNRAGIQADHAHRFPADLRRVFFGRP